MTTTTMTEKAIAIQDAAKAVNPNLWVPAVGNAQIAVFLEFVFTNPGVEQEVRRILGTPARLPGDHQITYENTDGRTVTTSVTKAEEVWNQPFHIHDVNFISKEVK